MHGVCLCDDENKDVTLTMTVHRQITKRFTTQIGLVTLGVLQSYSFYRNLIGRHFSADF